VAVSNGRTQIVEVLVEAGADLNYMDYDGRTPLDMVPVYDSDDHTDISQFLISRGAKTGSELRRNTNADYLNLSARMAAIDISSPGSQNAPRHAAATPAHGGLSEEPMTSPYPISQFIRPYSNSTVYFFEQSPHSKSASLPRAPMLESSRNVELNAWATPRMFTPKW
jgi:ankyrin repeat protein